MDEQTQAAIRQLVREEVERTLAQVFNTVADLMESTAEDAQVAPEGAR